MEYPESRRADNRFKFEKPSDCICFGATMGVGKGEERLAQVLKDLFDCCPYVASAV